MFILVWQEMNLQYYYRTVVLANKPMQHAYYHRLQEANSEL